MLALMGISLFSFAPAAETFFDLLAIAPKAINHRGEFERKR